jgi:hypothetical protein
MQDAVNDVVHVIDAVVRSQLYLSPADNRLHDRQLRWHRASHH